MNKRTKTRNLAARRSRPSNSEFNFETLEERRFMAAAIFAGVGADFNLLAPQAIIQSLQNPPTASPQIGRIVNGTQTAQYPSVGLIGDRQGFHCTGTLIGSRYVLTAAHCAEGVSNTAGRFQIGGQTYSTTRVVIHPQYNSDSLANDIAIFVLDRDVTDVQPTPIFRGTPQVGQMLTLVGFGAGGTGTSGENGDFGTKRVGTTPIDGVEPTLITWHFDNNSESNTAPGDSGGPAFVTVGGTTYIAGVTSGGNKSDAGIGDDSFDTRVDAFQTWIDGIVGTSTGTDTGTGTGTGGGTGGGGNSSDDHANSVGGEATAIPLNTNGIGAIGGNLEIAGDRDVFKIQVTAPGTAAIRATGLNGLDTVLRVYDASGKLVGENDDAGNSYNSLVNLRVTPGTYYVSVGSYRDSEAGRYSVNVKVTADAISGNYADDHSNTFFGTTYVRLNSVGFGYTAGKIEAANDVDMFRLTANQNGTMVIRTRTMTGNLDTMLTVYDARGRQVDFNDNFIGTDSRAIFRIVAGQTYFIKLSSNGNTTGDYRMTFRSISSRSQVAATIDVGHQESESQRNLRNRDACFSDNIRTLEY